MISSADVIAIGAHPDDVEISCGGSVASLVSLGYSVVIADLTRGELGSRGTPETRRQEAEKAANILGVPRRINLGLPDGNITSSIEQITAVVRLLRKFRPKILLIPSEFDRHIDHEDAYKLIRKSVFQSGLAKFISFENDVPQQPFRPTHVFSYMQTYETPSDFFVDISNSYTTKLAAIQAFGSQIFVPGAQDEEPQTFISKPEFIEMLEARARYFGARIGVRYAEGFRCIEPLGIPSLSIWL
ncbi:bacillithiol biosynthesis deacetylase BshB1 [Ignavibacteria bacterium]|nr:bacillithiol biosynthesis deacetylase BshB1 [Bacteroidota bacterium]MCZ2132192.1 bacillithiol biosynthesis deacetylase BshB1 [Bacteroidota bacterium]